MRTIAIALCLSFIGGSIRHAVPVAWAQERPDAAVTAALARPDLDAAMRQRLELYVLIDRARADAGMEPLQLDARLMDAASEHSSDMAATRRCRHAGSDGSSAKQRIRRHGYPHNNWAGENIICARRTPADAMRWWLASGPHRRNILHQQYTHIGIGFDPDGPYGPMWTLNFAAGAPDTAVPAVLALDPSEGAAGTPAHTR